MKKSSLPPPLEYDEQVVFVEYLNLKNLAHFHVPNGTWTKSFNQKKRNKKLGVSSGVPDLFVIVRGRLIAIEMKRVSDSTTSPAQKEWLRLLNEAGVQAVVCKGADNAIKFIEEML